MRTALERTGLDGKEKLRPGQLSYGLQRRVEIARAIVMSPKLLLLDEPTAGMNRFEREEIGRLMSDLRSEGLTQLIVEHDVQMMVDVCDHLFAMNSGQLIASGSPPTWCVIRRCARPISESRTTMIEIRDLHVDYGKVSAVRGCPSPRGRAG